MSRFLASAALSFAAAFTALAAHAQVLDTQPLRLLTDLAPVAGNWDATNCEYYVNSLARESRHYGGGGYDQTTLVTYISVNEQALVREQGATILNVGILANGRDAVLGYKLADAYYRIRFDLLHVAAFRNINYHYDLRNFLYFVDVQRATGSVERLWLKNGAQHFAWPSTLENYPKWWRTEGSNADAYVLDPSPIYAQKNFCVH